MENLISMGDLISYGYALTFLFGFIVGCLFCSIVIIFVLERDGRGK